MAVQDLAYFLQSWSKPQAGTRNQQNRNKGCEYNGCKYTTKQAAVLRLIDAYRIRSVDEFFEFGYEDYFFGEGLCLIEWPERIAPLLPEDALRLRLTHLGGDRRRIAPEGAARP